MSYQLPQDLTTTIDSLLASGKYASPEEVLRDALAALKERDLDLDAIAAGIADMEAGRVRTFADSDAEFRSRHQIPRS